MAPHLILNVFVQFARKNKVATVLPQPLRTPSVDTRFPTVGHSVDLLITQTLVDRRNKVNVK